MRMVTVVISVLWAAVDWNPALVVAKQRFKMGDSLMGSVSAIRTGGTLESHPEHSWKSCRPKWKLEVGLCEYSLLAGVPRKGAEKCLSKQRIVFTLERWSYGWFYFLRYLFVYFSICFSIVIIFSF